MSAFASSSDGWCIRRREWGAGAVRKIVLLLVAAAVLPLSLARQVRAQVPAESSPPTILLPPPDGIAERLPIPLPTPEEPHLDQPAEGNKPKPTSEDKPIKEKETSPKEQPAGKHPAPAESAEQTEQQQGVEAAKAVEKAKEERPPWYSIHGQATVIGQGNWMFHSPYQGPNSFVDAQSLRTTATSTLFLAAKLPWEGGLVVFDPEVAGGAGLSGTFGLGAFPNGEAVRVGDPTATPYVARLYYQQDFGLGGEWEKIEDGPNQVAGHRDLNRITIQIGRLPAIDLFDNNLYSHDPRIQFMNWALMYNASWDYPANTRGYNYGATIELNQPVWAIRYGVWLEPEFANGFAFDNNYGEANGHAVELEYRWNLDGPKGKVRLLVYGNHAHMGDYREALQMMPVNPDVTLTRAYRWKYGFALNLEQELTPDLGLFSRLGWDDGHTETWAFTECDRTATLGLLLKGRRWGRPQDEVGLAFVVDGLSQDHRAYLAAGGLGFELGDGKLNYGLEEVVETYYNWQLKKGINVTLDMQGVNNPGYNRDRGPIAIMSMRFHFEF
jgi:high affinity Mn2+ porin